MESRAMRRDGRRGANMRCREGVWIAKKNKNKGANERLQVKGVEQLITSAGVTWLLRRGAEPKTGAAGSVFAGS